MKGTSRILSTSEPTVALNRISIVNSIRYRRPPRYDLERLKFPEVVTEYVQSLETALPEEGEFIKAPLEDCWSNVKAAI